MTVNLENNIGRKISEALESENMSVEKLAYMTNIPLRFIVALKENDLERLPAAPYVRGYLSKIAPVLKTNPEELWAIYKGRTKFNASGAMDRLPSNQFAKVPIKKGWLIVGAILILITATVYTRYNDVFGVPELSVEIPAISPMSEITITGKVTPGDKLVVNEEVVYTEEDGSFEQKLDLSPGLNTIEFKVTRFLGKELVVVKQIVYEPLNIIEDNQNADIIKENTPAEK